METRQPAPQGLIPTVGSPAGGRRREEAGGLQTPWPSWQCSDFNSPLGADGLLRLWPHSHLPFQPGQTWTRSSACPSVGFALPPSHASAVPATTWGVQGWGSDAGQGRDAAETSRSQEEILPPTSGVRRCSGFSLPARPQHKDHLASTKYFPIVFPTKASASE